MNIVYISNRSIFFQNRYFYRNFYVRKYRINNQVNNDMYDKDNYEDRLNIQVINHLDDIMD